MEQAITEYKPRKWYNAYKFPLVPVIAVRKRNEYNTKSMSFHWLFFQFWTLDSVCIEASIVCSTHWGIGFIGLLPYLRWVITIPCPNGLEHWIQQNLWRKP